MMGNSHGTTTETQSSDQKRRRLAESRRLSAPSCRGRLAIMHCYDDTTSNNNGNNTANIDNNNKCETTDNGTNNNSQPLLLHHCKSTDTKPVLSVDELNKKPIIQVNGEDSLEDGTSMPQACSSNAAERRWKFLNSSNRIAMRSLEEGIDGDVQLTMKPLKDRARSLSPLKQLRTYSFRSTPSEESFLSDVQQYWIKRSWCSVIDRLRKENREFGFFVLKRVFDRAPHLKSAFLSHQQISLEELPPNHAIHRHLHILTKVIDLAVRNVDQLESEIAPTIFRYGQRHYHNRSRDLFDEQSVRLFCSQVVCTVFDYSDLNDANEPICVEAWVELMRYIGAKLLDGFQFEHLANTKKLAINTNDHVFFIL